MELAVELTRWKWQSHWRWKDLSSVEDTAYGSAIVAVVQSFLSAFALSVSPAEVAFASGTYGEPRVRQAILYVQHQADRLDWWIRNLSRPPLNQDVG